MEKLSFRVIGLWTSVSLFLLLHPPSSTFAQGDFETNDTPAQAVEIVLPFTGLRGQISTVTDIDFYKFTAPAGQDVTVLAKAFSQGTGLVPVLAFYGPTGQLLAYNDKEWNIAEDRPNDDPLLYLKTPAAGTYYISISNASLFRNGPFPALPSTGVYELYLFTKFFGAAPEDGNEPNDAAASATPIALPYLSHGTNLTQFGDVDWYRFTARKGDSVSIDIEALQMTSNPNFEMIVVPRVGVFDEAGRLLMVAGAGPDPDDGYALDPAVIFDVPKDGKYYIAVAAPVDADYDSPFDDADFLLNPYVSSSLGMLGHYQLEVRVLQKLYFAQIANGAFGSARFRTSVVLINLSAQAATGSVRFFRQDGSPMPVSVSAGAEASSLHYYSIPARSSALMMTDGSGPGESGYAVVYGLQALKGSAVFSQYDGDGHLVTEAGVPSGIQREFLSIPVDVSGEFNTGLAVANASGGAAANLSLKLISSDGQTIATRGMSLGPGQQWALFVSGNGQLFPNVTNFRGSLQVLADSPVVAVALRSSSRTLTTLPASDVNLAFDPVTLHFPQVVAGSGTIPYSSTLILSNPGFFTVTATARFTRSDGSPMPVTIGGTSSSVHSFTIPPLGTRFAEASPIGPFEVGYAVVEASHAISGVVIFSQYDSSGRLLTEAGVESAPRLNRFMLFVQSEGEFNTGLAVANVSAGGSTVGYRLRPQPDPDAYFDRGPLSLAGGRHRAELVSGPNQLFPSFVGLGTLEVTSTVAVPAVTLRITPTTMTVLPVVPVP